MINVSSFERNAADYNGKEQAEVFYITINGGGEKPVSKADLLKAIKMNLPERGTEADTTAATPTFPAMRTGS